MKNKHKKFVKILKKYLKFSPDLRITQALFNLGVTEKEVIGEKHYFRDNYNQNDKVTVKRAEETYEKQYKDFFKGIIEKKVKCSQEGEGRENKPHK